MIDIKHFRKTKSVFSYVVLQMVFCTRYNRNLFLDKKLSKRVTELIEEKCIELDIEIISMNIYPSYVNMIVASPPELSPNQVVSKVKGCCNKSVLKNEFDVLKSVPNLWTRDSLVSTMILVNDTVEAYVSSQKAKVTIRAQKLKHPEDKED